MGPIARTNDNSADLDWLRERINVLEHSSIGKSSSHGRDKVKLGVKEVDAILPRGGLKLAGLHEILPASIGNFSGFPVDGPATGFAAWLLKKCLAQRSGLALWVRRPAGRFDPQPYAPGLTAWLDPTRLLLVEAHQPEDLLWALEEGLRCPGVTAVLGEIGNADLTATRRLLLAAEGNGSTAILLRGANAATSSAALTRWRIAGAPSRSTEGLRDIARPHWRVELLRARGGSLGGGLAHGLDEPDSSWLMEWNDETGDLALASSPVDRSAGAPRPAVARPSGGDGGFGFRRTASRRG